MHSTTPATFVLLSTLLSTLSVVRGQPSNGECADAMALQLDEVVPGSLASGTAEAWYMISGTGEYLAATTCTGNSTLDNNVFDSVLDVYSGDCGNLVVLNSNDDSASCGNLKSRVGWQSDNNGVYYLRVMGYSGSVGAYGVTVFPSEATVPPSTLPPDSVLCDSATPLEPGVAVEGETTAPYLGVWYSFLGTGNDLVISTCTGTAALNSAVFDSVIEVYARDCDDLRFIMSDDEGGKCGNGKSAVILPSVLNLTYHVKVSEYLGLTGSFGIEVSDVL